MTTEQIFTSRMIKRHTIEYCDKAADMWLARMLKLMNFWDEFRKNLKSERDLERLENAIDKTEKRASDLKNEVARIRHRIRLNDREVLHDFITVLCTNSQCAFSNSYGSKSLSMRFSLFLNGPICTECGSKLISKADVDIDRQIAQFLPGY